jgi:hypothetical protein
MKKELIRTEIMNLTGEQWEIIEGIKKCGLIEVSTSELYNLIGFTGGMFFGGKANEREFKFIKEFYNYGRGMRKSIES